jgi:DNA-binding XRE family transcriptional regulator
MILIVRSLIFYIANRISQANLWRNRIKTKIQIEFGKRVRSLRLAKGYSQEELAFKAKLDRTYVGGIERGERNPSLKNIAKLAEILEVPISELFK